MPKMICNYLYKWFYNPDKFPNGYLINLTAEEWERLKSQIVISSKGGKVKLPKK